MPADFNPIAVNLITLWCDLHGNAIDQKEVGLSKWLTWNYLKLQSTLIVLHHGFHQIAHSILRLVFNDKHSILSVFVPTSKYQHLVLLNRQAPDVTSCNWQLQIQFLPLWILRLVFKNKKIQNFNRVSQICLTLLVSGEGVHS